MERELQQLMNERESSDQVLVSKENLYNKENEIAKKSKPLFHFTPSAHDNSSLARLVGNHRLHVHTCKYRFNSYCSPSIYRITDAQLHVHNYTRNLYVTFPLSLSLVLSVDIMYVF